VDISIIQEIYSKERRIFSEDMGVRQEGEHKHVQFFWYRTVIHRSEDEARLKLGFEVGNSKDTFVSLDLTCR